MGRLDVHAAANVDIQVALTGEGVDPVCADVARGEDVAADEGDDRAVRPGGARVNRRRVAEVGRRARILQGDDCGLCAVAGRAYADGRVPGIDVHVPTRKGVGIARSLGLQARGGAVDRGDRYCAVSDSIGLTATDGADTERIAVARRGDDIAGADKHRAAGTRVDAHGAEHPVGRDVAEGGMDRARRAEVRARRVAKLRRGLGRARDGDVQTGSGTCLNACGVAVDGGGGDVTRHGDLAAEQRGAGAEIHARRLSVEALDVDAAEAEVGVMRGGCVNPGGVAGALLRSLRRRPPGKHRRR